MNLLAWQRRLRPLLLPAAQTYAVLMHIRRRAYESGVLPATTLCAPCVSVGNICWGGSGKTPMVAWLLSWAAIQGLRPVVLTRGYRATPPKLPYEVRCDSPEQEAGDEPLLLKQGCPQATVLLDPKRTRSGRFASRLQPDLFILDDGFQHLAVGRDINLVLMREEDLDEQWNRGIPSGSWREPASALQRASVFLIKCVRRPPEEVLPEAVARLGRYKKAIYTFSLHAKQILNVQTAAAASLDTRYLLATGIADPASVARTAASLLERAPETVLTFPDHHCFTKKDWEYILRTCRAHGADAVLCTPKDAVKLRKFAYNRLYTFDMTLAFGPYANEQSPFPDWWSHCFLDCEQKKHIIKR